ncbi:hypothetical protein HQ590_12975, partial [bacterium]|nr:hypothetical protein [bacterium]
VMAKTYGDAITNTVAEINSLPSALGIFSSMAEGIVSDSPDLRAEAQFNAALRPKLKRPLGIMDNHSQIYPWNAEPGGILDSIELLYMEREQGGMFRPELSLRDWMKRKPTWMICDLPQTYENVPHARERYVSLRNTLHGARGWFGIQGCCDPSLYRGLGGELRHIFTYIAANEPGPVVTAPAGVTVQAWQKDNRVLVMAEQHNPVPHGRWEWATDVGDRAGPAHSGESRHIVTPVKEGYAIHGYNDDLYREIGAGDRIRQEVYVDPQQPPTAVFLIVPGNNDFNQIAYWGAFDWNDFKAKQVDAFLAGECYSMVGMGVNSKHTTDPVYLGYQAKRRFPQAAFVRLGDLPQPGQWATLTVPLDKLGLAGKVVDGLMFMTSGNGQAWWGTSALVRSDGREEVMVDGRIGRDSARFQQTTLKIDGLQNGTVRVVGENRQLRMQDGAWTDDLEGEDLWGFFGDGWLGDGVTYYQPRDSVPAELFLGYTYDDSPRCIRVYEITPGK